MNYNCLVVDLTSATATKPWQTELAVQSMAMPVLVVESIPEARELIDSGAALVLAIVAAELNGDVQSLLKSYQNNMGCLSDFQAIVADDPDPRFMAGIFEYGVDQFLGASTWPAELAALTRQADELTRDEASVESKTIKMTRAIRLADQEAIRLTQPDLVVLATYDYRAAFTLGKAFEAASDYANATATYGNAAALNRFFRPAASSYGEALLVMGRVEEAFNVFYLLEQTNPFDVERKANLATAYVEMGDFKAAQDLLAAAAAISPLNSRVLEAKAQVFLCTGRVNEAFQLMDGMSEVGPFFAAKLNELGIKLSQTGKGKSALALYQKAHKIVRPDLRYKISMNAALACRRLQAWDMALKYIVRCDQESGGQNPKVEKIRLSVLEAIEQAKQGGGVAEKVS